MRFGFLANCSVRFRIFFLFAIVALLSSNLSGADDEDEGELTFCNFGPKVGVVLPRGSSDVHEKGANPCVAKVHVQGVLWKCGSPDAVASTVEKFFGDLNDRARDECRKYCENLGSGCVAVYKKKQECGIATTRETAIRLGKEFGCRKDCTDGKAFTYCSIYNTGYQGPNPERVLAQTPNCECKPGTP